ncbi:hypothetical protein F751_4600 [Auxenochlorella protothecoides]|uniref:Uncharacterized protein n=1 Tax=Auxenochlorella protothecoides TaxID=3075 RepID=A0A087SNM6_AUXPR|nr:hypothetical protein F751_4600 [Auxenochlorella protothecoides]KFM27330.1 hypothetical protein F751_4600 [Auxenochlorella protothecoides]
MLCCGEHAVHRHQLGLGVLQAGGGVTDQLLKLGVVGPLVLQGIEIVVQSQLLLCQPGLE